MLAVNRHLRRAVGWLDNLVGGPARRHVIFVFACVLALDSADKATIGASATQLQAGLGIDKTAIGLLLSVSSLVGGVATVPAGILIDRINRSRLLSGAVLCWGAAMALSGTATGFIYLVLTRVALGVMTAVAGPAVASMIGDYFPPRERGRVYGYVLSGELIGAGFGFLIAGQFATLSWRASFFALVVPTAGVWWVARRLPEPERGGASRMSPGTTEIGGGRGADSQDDTQDDTQPDNEDAPGHDQDASLAHATVRAQHVNPANDTVLRTAPTDLSLWQAVRYVLRVRTNVVLIVASALGYFYYSGLRGFAVEFAKQHYGVSQSTATSLTIVLGLGALGGVLLGGRLADRLLRRGRLAARVEVPGVASLLAALLFLPALIVTTIWLAVLLLLLAALCLGTTNPPLDAARLDIIHPRIWGRAEAVRTVLRNGADALAPLLFGFLATSVFTEGQGLEYTFLLFLASLFAAGVIVLLIGRRTYGRDVAAAARSVECTGAMNRPG